MNSAHFHLIMNHVPVVGVLFGALLLTLGVFRRDTGVQRIGLFLIVIVALATIPSYLSGESAEEIVEHLPGITESIVEEHEEAALPALILAEVLGFVALLGLILFRKAKELPQKYVYGVLAGTVLLSIVMARVANLGGAIRHPEILPDFQVPVNSTEDAH